MDGLLKKLAQFASTLGINFVPALGWLFDDWSAGTTLGVYWFENVAASLLVASRIRLHQKLTPRRGHFEYAARNPTGRRGSLLASFLPTSLIFSAAHGFFLAVLVFVLTANGHGAEIGASAASLWKGCGLVLVLLLISFACDLWNLRRKPFAWIERQVDLNLSRVVLVHLTIIFGVGAVAFTGMNRAFFAVFIVLKTLGDLAAFLPQWDPEKPPRWLCWLMDKVPSAQSEQKTFAEFWAADKKAERERRDRNERSVQA